MVGKSIFHNSTFHLFLTVKVLSAERLKDQSNSFKTCFSELDISYRCGQVMLNFPQSMECSSLDRPGR